MTNVKKQTLTKNEARELFKQEIEIASSKVSLPIGRISYYFLDLRYKIIVNLLNFRPNYFIERHRYNEHDRFLLDIGLLSIIFEKSKQGEPITLIERLRYKYYYLTYRHEFKRDNKQEWVRVSSILAKQPKYIHRDDYLAGKTYQYNGPKFWLKS
jgi:hypothetical protein